MVQAGANELRFDGQVAIITGAGGGLGRLYAMALAARGAGVVVNDVGSSVNGEGAATGPAESVAREIQELGGEAVPDTNTVATSEGGRAILATALEAFGRVDVLVNNAGALRDKAFHNLSDEQLQTVLDVNLTGAFYVTRPVWARMREQGYGRVLMVTSSSGLLGNFGQSNYAAAKMGLVGLTRVLAAEGAKVNIKVNAIAPLARTRMTEGLFGELESKLAPELVVPAVIWLVHRDVPVSGEVFSAAGGRVARFFVGLTRGYWDPALTPETLRDHMADVLDEDGYSVPAGLAEELAQLRDVLP